MSKKITIKFGGGDISIEAEGDEEKISNTIKDVLGAIKSNLGDIQDINKSLSMVTSNERSEKSEHSNEKGAISLNDPFNDFIKRHKINPKGLSEVFDFSGSYPILITEIGGSSRVERQIKASLLILLAYKKHYGGEKLTSNELVKALDSSSIDTDMIWNATTTMKRDRYIARAKHSKTNTITSKGEQEAVSALRELLGD